MSSPRAGSDARLLLLALALSLACAISLGITRFAYALLLPPMRSDLQWSYTLAGAMNTANAVGYLLGALLTPALLRRWSASAVLLWGAVLASVFMGLSGFFTSAGPLLLQRLLAGLASAFVLVAGSLLAVRLGALHPARSGLLIGLYYGGTGVIALLGEQGVGPARLTVFYALLGLAVLASSRIWSGLLDRFDGGQPMTILSSLLGVAIIIPALTAKWAAVLASGLLFGAVFLSIVGATTALVRHNLPATQWAAGISAFTVMFAIGQIVGPTVVGWIADGEGGLARGLLFSAGALWLGAAIAWRQPPLATARAGALI